MLLNQKTGFFKSNGSNIFCSEDYFPVEISREKNLQEVVSNG